jgi:hypothetical protein
MSDLFGVGGQQLLDRLELDAPYAARVASLRRQIDAFTFEIDVLATRTAADLRGIPVGGRSRPSTVSARSWRRCSSRRSATCTGFADPSSCVPGPG